MENQLDNASAVSFGPPVLLKPTVIGAGSAFLLIAILVTIYFWSRSTEAAHNIPAAPILAFVVLRAIISAASPAPSNFSSPQGQVHFLLAQGGKSSRALSCVFGNEIVAAVHDSRQR